MCAVCAAADPRRRVQNMRRRNQYQPACFRADGIEYGAQQRALAIAARVRDGLRALSARDHAIESWLHTEVSSAYDELKADPSQGIPAQQIRDQLAKLHESRVRGNGS